MRAGVFGLSILLINSPNDIQFARTQQCGGSSGGRAIVTRYQANFASALLGYWPQFWIITICHRFESYPPHLHSSKICGCSSEAEHRSNSDTKSINCRRKVRPAAEDCGLSLTNPGVARFESSPSAPIWRRTSTTGNSYS